MAYESKIYVVNLRREKNENSPDYGKVYNAQRIAAFDLGCMGSNNGWRELFDTPIDYEFYAEDGENLITEDKYGDQLTSADIDVVIRWLETKGNAFYRRIAPALGMLKGFNRSEWEELKIVHFGH